MSLKPFALIAPDACVVTCGYRLHSEIISRSHLLIRQLKYDYPFRFDRNEARFTEAYPEHEQGVTVLLKAIQKAGVARKTIIPRKRKTVNEDG